MGEFTMFYIIDTANKMVVAGPFANWGLAYDNLLTVTVPSDYPDGGVLEIFGLAGFPTE
jgi:hypothetical protein